MNIFSCGGSYFELCVVFLEQGMSQHTQLIPMYAYDRLGIYFFQITYARN